MTFKEWFDDMQERYQAYYGGYEELLQEAFEAGAKQEREACAKEADKRLHDFTMLTSNPPQSGAAFSIAQAIRARGEA